MKHFWHASAQHDLKIKPKDFFGKKTEMFVIRRKALSLAQELNDNLSEAYLEPIRRPMMDIFLWKQLTVKSIDVSL